MKLRFSHEQTIEVIKVYEAEVKGTAQQPLSQAAASSVLRELRVVRR